MPAPTTSPLANPTGVSVNTGGYTITVGGGGAGAICSPTSGARGNPSTFSTITSTGGGGGSVFNGADAAPLPGGSGGGAGRQGPETNFGTGNTPPVSPPQGFNGGAGSPNCGDADGGGGGGGAGAVGINGSPSGGGGGGAGSFISPFFATPGQGTPGPVGSVRYFAGGGGGVQHRNQSPATPGPGGAGGGGQGSPTSPGNGTAGTTNTGGGGGAGRGAPSTGGAGGSGMVIIRYKFQ
tara:strand:- start:21 stop:731 length:711 start_codon:yes stop_codon:yes gene_type:complete